MLQERADALINNGTGRGYMLSPEGIPLTSLDDLYDSVMYFQPDYKRIFDDLEKIHPTEVVEKKLGEYKDLSKKADININVVYTLASEMVDLLLPYVNEIHDTYFSQYPADIPKIVKNSLSCAIENFDSENDDSFSSHFLKPVYKTFESYYRKLYMWEID